MEEKLELKYPVVVEGRYDKAKVASVVSSPVITLEGFGIFNNTEKRALLKRLCAENGLIILTDSDRAGNFIRSKLKGFLKENVYNVYIPEVRGKEKRKSAPSADGLLGVEAISHDELRRLLAPFAGGIKRGGAEITEADFYALGLSGGANSAGKRALLAKELSLPSTLTKKALIEAINLTVTAEEFKDACDRIQNV